VQFRGFIWPHEAAQLLKISILDVQAFKDHMAKHNGVPKTINRRISSLSSFDKFLSGAAAELRLPITVPNPAHAQFIARAGPPTRLRIPVHSRKHVRGSLWQWCLAKRSSNCLTGRF
jgi:hypothetical protein